MEVGEAKHSRKECEQEQGSEIKQGSRAPSVLPRGGGVGRLTSVVESAGALNARVKGVDCILRQGDRGATQSEFYFARRNLLAILRCTEGKKSWYEVEPVVRRLMLHSR